MEKQPVLTPVPCYIPGYTGHCPQLKFSVGKSYGKLAAELLASREVKRSSRLALGTGNVPSTKSDADLTLKDNPDTELKMIPGYSGWIPRSQNYFGCGFSETCRKALSDFHQDRRGKLQRQSVALPAVVNSNNQQCERPKPPVTAISNKVNTDKSFMSGCAGHVPNSRFLHGKSHLIITNQALIQFEKQQQSGPKGQKDSTISPLPKIYESHPGVVPSFTGHIPGYQFMYGHTFGQLSKNALEKRIFQEKS